MNNNDKHIETTNGHLKADWKPEKTTLQKSINIKKTHKVHSHYNSQIDHLLNSTAQTMSQNCCKNCAHLIVHTQQNWRSDTSGHKIHSTQLQTQTHRGARRPPDSRENHMEDTKTIWMIGGSSWCKCVCAASVYWPSDSKGGGQRRSDPNSQERRSEFPFSATPSIVFLFNERWAIGPGWGREEGGEPEPWEPSTSLLTAGMDEQEGRGLMSRAWTVPCSQQSTEDSEYLAWKGKGGERRRWEWLSIPTGAPTLPCFSQWYVTNMGKRDKSKNQGSASRTLFLVQCV